MASLSTCHLGLWLGWQVCWIRNRNRPRVGGIGIGLKTDKGVGIGLGIAYVESTPCLLTAVLLNMICATCRHLANAKLSFGERKVTAALQGVQVICKCKCALSSQVVHYKLRSHLGLMHELFMFARMQWI